MRSLIGIYTRPSDDHVERVVTELQRRALPWIRFDTADFPQALQLTAHLDPEIQGWRGEFLHRNTPYHLENFRSIWYRRPTKRFHFPEGLSEEGMEYARAEAQRGIGGLLAHLSTQWVSHPDALRAAEWKPGQLVAAQQHGFQIPRTLLTNDPLAALQFFEACHGEIVYKPLNQGTPRPRPGKQWQGAIYTTKLTRSDLETYAPTIALTTHLFQEYLPKAFELRVTVIGSRVFAAEIHSQHSARSRVDFRLSYEDLWYGIHRLPSSIETACRSLVQHFHLLFSAIDLIVTPDGDYVFLESNPGGQWGWIERQTGLPLTEALVDLLAQEGTEVL